MTWGRATRYRKGNKVTPCRHQDREPMLFSGFRCLLVSHWSRERNSSFDGRAPLLEVLWLRWDNYRDVPNRLVGIPSHVRCIYECYLREGWWGPGQDHDPATGKIIPSGVGNAIMLPIMPCCMRKTLLSVVQIRPWNICRFEKRIWLSKLVGYVTKATWIWLPGISQVQVLFRKGSMNVCGWMWSAVVHKNIL